MKSLKSFECKVMLPHARRISFIRANAFLLLCTKETQLNARPAETKEQPFAE